MSDLIWQAEDYNRFSEPQYAIAVDLLKSYLPKLEPGNSVLDLGCGSGRITDWMAKQCADLDVIGVDSSQAMIAFAKTHYQATNLSFKQEDALTFCKPDAFDFIFSFWMMHLLPMAEDHLKALINIRKNLKKQGRLLLMVPLKHPGLIGIVFHALKECGISFKKYRFMPAEANYKALCFQAGFSSELTIESKTFYWDFNGFKALKNFISIILPHVNMKDECTRELVIESVAKKYQQYLLEHEGRLSARFLCLLIKR